MRVVNIKENNPNFEYAVFLLDQAIHDATICGEKGLIIIHGYGSHGRGGDIKRSAIRYLMKCKRNSVIKDFVKGEEWTESSKVVQDALKECPELVLQQNLYQLNSGVTVVLLF